MRIIDAQVHIWSSGTPLPAHGTASKFTAEDLIADMDAAGVDRAVLHPPGWDPHGNEFAVDAARRYPHRFDVLGHLPLERPESRSLVADWLKQPGMRGMRYALVHPSEKDWPDDGTMDWLWPVAERLRMPISLQAGRFLPVLHRVAERHPQLPLIIDHLGLVRGGKGDAAFATLPDLLRLARLPNVAIKASGVPTYSSQAYPFRDTHDGLRAIFDAFGPSRFFWGTDLTRMPCSYRQCVTLFTEELPWLTSGDLSLVMGQALANWIGIEPDPSP